MMVLFDPFRFPHKSILLLSVRSVGAQLPRKYWGLSARQRPPPTENRPRPKPSQITTRRHTNPKTMASSMLALSVLCILPNSHHTIAWTTTANAKIRRRNHNPRPDSFLSLSNNVPTTPAVVVATLVDGGGEESLQHLTVPEIKEMLRSNGHKVRGVCASRYDTTDR